MSFLKPELLPWVLHKIVLPQHTDHAGVMWHGSYVNWLEEARISALSATGISYSEVSIQGYEMPVVDLTIKFMSPLRHGDNVSLESFVLPKKGPRLPWETNFLNESGDLMARANVDLVLISREKLGYRVLRKEPKFIAEAFFALQEGPLK